jgi:hypothetical protein
LYRLRQRGFNAKIVEVRLHPESISDPSY